MRRRAQQAVTPAVRTLGALHLASALRMRDQLTSFVTYDRRLADGARNAGLTVNTPTRQVATR